MSLRVGIVGAGLIGRRRAEVIQQDAHSELVMVADVDGGRASSLAQELDCAATTEWRDLVSHDTVDAVVVSTFNKFLAPIAIAAAGQGKHVLCEKPLGRTARDAAEVAEAAQRAGVKLKVGFNLRFHPALREAHDLCERGVIGQPLYIRAAYGHGGRPGYEREWRGDPDLAGGGELLDQGVHVADLCRWFLGEFHHVAGTIARGFWDIDPLEDNAFAMLSAESGSVALFHTSWMQWKNRFHFEVIGRDGYLTVQGLGGSYGTEELTIGRRRAEGGAPMEEKKAFDGPDESWQDEWREFVQSIRENREPMSNGRDGVRTMQLIQAIYDASATRSVVSLPVEGGHPVLVGATPGQATPGQATPSQTQVDR